MGKQNTVPDHIGGKKAIHLGQGHPWALIVETVIKINNANRTEQIAGYKLKALVCPATISAGCFCLMMLGFKASSVTSALGAPAIFPASSFIDVRDHRLIF
jgi:hypothetical protein